MDTRDINLHQRLLKLLYDHNEEHVGSCFTCVDIIDEIFKNKNEDDIFVLSNGHAAYALYVVLEKYYDHIDADALAVTPIGMKTIISMCQRAAWDLVLLSQ